MIPETHNAWVIHKQWSGAAHAYVSFFTDEKGVVKAFYKGGRSTKKQSLLQMFTPLWLHINRKAQWSYVQQLESTGPMILLNRHPLFSGLYLNELLHRLLPPEEPCKELFQAYAYTLSSLANIHDKLALERLLRRFEWQLLTISGYQLCLTHDNDGYPIALDKQYTWLSGQGLIEVSQGWLGKHLLACAADKLEETEVLYVYKQVMRCAIDFALDGKPVKARALFLRYES